jgi:hypothetical protein
VSPGAKEVKVFWFFFAKKNKMKELLFEKKKIFVLLPLADASPMHPAQ